MSVRVADVIETQNNLTSFPVAYGKDVWLDKNKGSGTPDYSSLQNLFNSGELGGGGSVQVETMPAASAENVGKIVQYVGASGSYKKGHFYECVHNKCDVLQPVYRWIDVSSYRYNHVVYNQTTEPINSDFIAGDIIYYTGVLTDKFKPNHYYRALPSIGTMEKYTFTMYRSTYGGMGFWSYTPFEFRQGFIVYPTSGGGEWEPYEITSITDEKVTITPYGDWGGEPLEFDGVLYTSEVKDWEELEGGGGDEEFIGTQAEWNALTAQEKEKYDGKIVNIVEDGKTSTQEVEELTNYLFTEQALVAFPDITQRFHVYKYGRLIQISCDNLQLNRTLLNSDYFKIAEGLPAPVYTVNFTYPTYPDESVGKSSIATAYVGTGGNVMLRHIGMISDSATYLQGFTVVYLTRGV